MNHEVGVIQVKKSQQFCAYVMRISGLSPFLSTNKSLSYVYKETWKMILLLIETKRCRKSLFSSSLLKFELPSISATQIPDLT